MGFTEEIKNHSKEIKEIIKNKELGKGRYVTAIRKCMEYPSFLFFPNAEE